MVTRHGNLVAVLLSIEDEEEWSAWSLPILPSFERYWMRHGTQIRETDGIGHEEFWQELEVGGTPMARRALEEPAALAPLPKWASWLTGSISSRDAGKRDSDELTAGVWHPARGRPERDGL